jgi:WD40 repeat protein
VRANFGFESNFIVSGSEDNFVYIWDIKKNRYLGRLGSLNNLYGHAGQVNEVITVGSDLIVSGGDDCSVIVWNVIK